MQWTEKYLYMQGPGRVSVQQAGKELFADLFKLPGGMPGAMWQAAFMEKGRATAEVPISTEDDEVVLAQFLPINAVRWDILKVFYRVTEDPSTGQPTVDLQLWWEANCGGRARELHLRLDPLLRCAWTHNWHRVADLTLMPDGRAVHRGAFEAAMQDRADAIAVRVRLAVTRELQLWVYDLGVYSRADVRAYHEDLQGRLRIPSPQARSVTGPAPVFKLQWRLERSDRFLYVKAGRTLRGYALVEVLNPNPISIFEVEESP